eukprot:TRINITY_DN12632_c0_g1_i1.p1 TRINITY_DN12632_c0_g1~~TRINITY_DN12632_c0_g1_i1.p1  ORF type:complete len:384 (-),score=67.25 TRINITY_DN12632_c0_g1_i1:66-1217(-)
MPWQCRPCAAMLSEFALLGALCAVGGESHATFNGTSQELTSTGFSCVSNLKLGSMADAQKKGLALDDTTLEHCPEEIPEVWPHTFTKVRSLRLFKAWGRHFQADRQAAWAKLKAFAEQNDVKILLGTPVSCNKVEDENEWRLAKQFMEYVGAHRIMGLAIGNELELLHKKGSEFVTNECLGRLFDGKGYLHEFQRRTSEIDVMPGFAGMDVTAVFGLFAISGSPFVDDWNARIATFLKDAWRLYGQRFVFSFNIYPYFDMKAHCAPHFIKFCTNFYNGWVPTYVGYVRQRMQAIGSASARLWIGEVGWSLPQSPNVAEPVRDCEEFSSAATFKDFYNNFLTWDMATHGVDHAFYFTIHDSWNFHLHEHFGLIQSCGSKECKLQ